MLKSINNQIQSKFSNKFYVQFVAGKLVKLNAYNETVFNYVKSIGFEPIF